MFQVWKARNIARDCKTPVPVSNALRIMGSTLVVNESLRARVYDMSMKDAIQDTDVVEGMLNNYQIKSVYLLTKCVRTVRLRFMAIKFCADLIPFKLGEYDVILGMNWQSKHDVQIDYRNKMVILKTPDEQVVTFKGQRQVKKFLTMIQAKKLPRQECEHFIAYVIDRNQKPAKFQNISVVNEFTNVFLDELLGLPPVREIEFVINLAP
ncbi:uncharacterized protein LOC141700940 [Apium graveolens]|uniref:uncharacterized protein LOC141700940 n=1 Tax=Apium graveolens TaxID=4045 RepID=UPI003D7AF62A